MAEAKTNPDRPGRRSAAPSIQILTDRSEMGKTSLTIWVCSRFNACLRRRLGLVARCALATCVFCSLLVPSRLYAEDKPEPPRIGMAVPFAIRANSTTKVILRGWKLNRDIEAKSTEPNVTIKVIRHDTAPVPNGLDAKQVGDSLVELEVSAPEGFAATTLPITLTAGGTESSPYQLLVGGKHPVIAEVEPNEGFRQAQQITVPQIVDGQIRADRDVDVYAVELAMSQRFVVEVVARRQGSGLDSLLTIFDSQGRKILANDDTDGADSKIDTTLAPGRYFIVVQDAHDHGGAAHPYRLIVSN